jgi:hypothetical protein
VIYAQIKSGKRLHLVYEPGEGKDDSSIVRAGNLSLPLCGRTFAGNYRMSCNLPLGNACRACNRVYNARYREGLLADHERTTRHRPDRRAARPETHLRDRQAHQAARFPQARDQSIAETAALARVRRDGLG